jgi:hypothetical protein
MQFQCKLEKIGAEDSKKDNHSSPPSPTTALTPDLMKTDFDLLKKLQAETL